MTRTRLWKQFHASKARFHVTTNFNCLVRAAQKGNGAAQFELALRYLDGRDVPSSAEAAATWFQRAADIGHADAMVGLARLTLQGVNPVDSGKTLFAEAGATPDFARAATWAKRAADLGAVEGKVIFATLLADGPEEFRDVGTAHELLLEAVSCGSPLGCLSLALLLASQRPLETDPAYITGLLQSAADGNVPLAMYLFGIARELGFGCTQDISAATTYFLRSAESGICSGQTRAGRALMDGRGIERDIVMGESWLRKAALSGDGRAATLVGEIYAKSGSLPPNYPEAAMWFHKAAELGDATAAQILALFHLTGMGFQSDAHEASRWFARAQKLNVGATNDDPAELIPVSKGVSQRSINIRSWFEPDARVGDHTAAYRLGVCLTTGIGGERDYKLAAKYLYVAAETIIEAKLLYGQLLSDGNGVPQNEVAARQMIKSAADKGVVNACVALAEMMAKGRGGDQDIKGAVVLFTLAANNGHIGAMFALGALYGGGNGLPADRPLAQHWFWKAATGGHIKAQVTLGRYLANGFAGECSIEAALQWFGVAYENGSTEGLEELNALSKPKVRETP